MDYRTIDREGVLAREINARLVERIRSMTPAHRTVGQHVDWRRRDVLAGKIPPAGVLVPLLAHAIVTDTPTDAITDVLDDARLVVVRERAPELLGGEPVPAWTEASCRETDVQGPADSAQTRALTTRSIGDMMAARTRALRHIEAQWRYVVALDRAIGDEEATTRAASARLRQMLPTSA